MQWRLHAAHAEAIHGALKPLQAERLRRFHVEQRLQLRVDRPRNQDLAARRLAAQPRREVGDGADRPVVPAPFEADRADGRDSPARCRCRGSARIRARAQLSAIVADAFADRERHPDGALGGVGHGHRVVEEDHHAVAGEALQRAFVRAGSARRSPRGTRAARPSPPRAPTRSAKAVKPRRSRNTTVISRRWLCSGSSAPPLTISSASCGEKKRRSRPTRSSSATCSATRRSSDAFHCLHLAGQRLDRGRAGLDAQHRAHARDERGVVHRLGQVLVAARFEPRDDVLRVRHRGDHDDGREGEVRVGAQAPAHLDAVELRHHDVEQDQVGLSCRARRRGASSPSAAETTS